MTILYRDEAVAVCVKPAGVLSTDEAGGMPELLRAALGVSDVRSVHRLDRVVSGLMVYALSAEAAAALSRSIREGTFQKEYLGVIHFRPHEDAGTFRDLLWRDPAERKTKVVKEAGKDVREALLDYELLGWVGGLSLVRVTLRTGRTHQIRAQFSSRGLPLWGDKKYSRWPDEGPIALWSHRLRFPHPVTGEAMNFSAPPPAVEPWTRFGAVL